MKKLIKNLLICCLFCSLTNVYSQENVVKTKTKSNQSNDRLAGDVAVKAGTIHLEIDGSGNPIFYLPSKSPLAIVFNAVTNGYEVKAPRDVATGQSSGKRQHGTVKISKSAEGASKGIPDAGITLLFDGNGDCDLAKLGLSGVMDVCYVWTPVFPSMGKSCFTITLDGQGMVTRYDVKQNNKR